MVVLGRNETIWVIALKGGDYLGCSFSGASDYLGGSSTGNETIWVAALRVDGTIWVAV